jgi:hypothetical protein
MGVPSYNILSKIFLQHIAGVELDYIIQRIQKVAVHLGYGM